MVDVAQLVEHQIVALVVVGSIPTIHPKKIESQMYRIFTCKSLAKQVNYLHKIFAIIRVGMWRNW
jgi:hypothetical protein